MFKNIAKFIMISITVTFMTSACVLAANETTTPVPTDIKLKQIDELKERLATKVAELQQLQRKAVFGVVKAVSVSNFTLETQTKDIKIELPDEIKIYQIISGKRTQLTIDDLAKEDVVTVFGNYDSTLDLLKAKVIFIQGKIPTRISGVVKEVNKTDFTVSLSTVEGTSYLVDIEAFTKSFVWDKEKGLTKIGFSKINIGDIIHVLGTPVPKKDNRISANRILDLTDLSGNPNPTPTTAITQTPTAKPIASPTP